MFHELGHLLKKHTVIDIDCESSNTEESWCNKLAGCILMPPDSNLFDGSFKELKDIKRVAKKFKVSPYSFLVRLKQLNKINQIEYKNFEGELIKEYKKQKRKMQNSLGGPSRNITQEIQKQFGSPFMRSILHALQNKEMTLHKASQILHIKNNPSQVLGLEKIS